MKQILVALFAGLILGLLTACTPPAKPHVPGPEINQQYVDGWRYSQVGDKAIFVTSRVDASLVTTSTITATHRSGDCIGLALTNSGSQK